MLFGAGISYLELVVEHSREDLNRLLPAQVGPKQRSKVDIDDSDAVNNNRGKESLLYCILEKEDLVWQLVVAHTPIQHHSLHEHIVIPRHVQTAEAG